MREINLPLAEGAVQEEGYKMPEGHHLIVVHLHDHTWAAVAREGRELVRDNSRDPQAGFSLPPGDYTIRTDGVIDEITSEAATPSPSLVQAFAGKPLALLNLTSDAPDRHVVDGVGEIVADGRSFCTIKVEKVDLGGEPLTGKAQKDELFLRTTGGTLMDETGKSRIRTLRLKSGQAAFRLVSEASPRLVTVYVFGKDSFIRNAEIQIEFV